MCKWLVVAVVALLWVTPAQAESSACRPTIEGGTLVVRTCQVITHVERTIDLGNLPELLSPQKLQALLPRLATLSQGEHVVAHKETKFSTVLPPTKHVRSIEVRRTPEGFVAVEETTTRSDPIVRCIMGLIALTSVASTIIGCREQKGVLGRPVALGILTGVVVGVIFAWFAGAFAGIFAGIFAGMFAGIFAGGWFAGGWFAGGFAGAFAGMFAGEYGITAPPPSNGSSFAAHLWCWSISWCTATTPSAERERQGALALKSTGPHVKVGALYFLVHLKY